MANSSSKQTLMKIIQDVASRSMSRFIGMPTTGPTRAHIKEALERTLESLSERSLVPKYRVSVEVDPTDAFQLKVFFDPDHERMEVPWP